MKGRKVRKGRRVTAVLREVLHKFLKKLQRALLLDRGEIEEIKETG
jgi:hypothetical protein